MDKEKKNRKKKRTFYLLLSISFASLFLSLICLIVLIINAISINKRIDTIENHIAIENTPESKKDTDKDKSYADPTIEEDLHMSTIDIEGIEVVYPSSGSIGKKGFYKYPTDENEYYLEIESFDFTEPSGMQVFGGSTISYNVEFVGTDYYWYTPRFSYKEYDAEGYFIKEQEVYLGRGGLGEQLKLRGIVEIDSNADKVIFDVKP